jgi:predicted nuclease of predicted toxin-antitoxin system
MKFLLNMNVDRTLGAELKRRGHSCHHAGDIGLSRATDVEIISEARRANEVIITHDLDYGHLLAFSGEKAPSVIILRLRDLHSDQVSLRIDSVWEEIESPLVEGAIISLSDKSLRIRSLPIESN